MQHMQQQPGSAHPLIGRVLDWWHDVRDSWRRMHELETLSDHELARIAHDVGMSSDELVRAAAAPSGTGLLLERRLASLGLDAEEIRKLSPLILADLQRTCALCTEKGRCAHDFETSEDQAGWESYCPNSGTLRTLA